ncbi:MAG TPA: alpha/beta fold hydrolase [Blastocatellia bacterium]|jgi:predicted alpha/beta-fold hydrolase
MMKDVAEQLLQKTFTPHPALRNAHAQTLAGYLIRRRTPLLDDNTEERLFRVAPNARLLAHCSWHKERASRPTLVVAHGLEGSSISSYMLGTAEKALRAGFNCVRLNFRNCGGTAHLSDTLYHAGLTGDLRAVVDELIERDQLNDIYLVGFSLGGNVALKLAGEYGRDAPSALRGVIAVSPSIHLSSCARTIERRSNRLYHLSFLNSLRKSLRAKARLFPDRYDASHLKRIKSIRQFDETYVAPHWGFRDAEDYYARASALPLVGRIQIPTLLLHAKDDPFIPFDQFESREIEENPFILLLATERGGHVGFIARTREDRFWYEAMTAEFVRLTSRCRIEVPA